MKVSILKTANLERIITSVQRITAEDVEAVVFVNKSNLPSCSRGINEVFNRVPVHKIIGVYDINVKAEWVEEDLMAMGFCHE